MSDLSGIEIQPPLLMNLPDAARILGVHRSTLHKICLAGSGPKWIWVGSKIMIPRNEFIRWLSSANRNGAGHRLLGEGV